jgi:hypothetical protein
MLSSIATSAARGVQLASGQNMSVDNDVGSSLVDY